LRWTQEPATFEGRYYQFHQAHFGPKPLQKPLPLVFDFTPETIGNALATLTTRSEAATGGGVLPAIRFSLGTTISIFYHTAVAR
jgi:alkanesulfonate monooxygenase SsuD/methylene tetrahydromethanopterin reductase-like flavin-dependent oxidoreductase (luciferase family)